MQFFFLAFSFYVKLNQGCNISFYFCSVRYKEYDYITPNAYIHEMNTYPLMIFLIPQKYFLVTTFSSLSDYA